MTAEVVAAYVGSPSIATVDLPALIGSVFASLGRLGGPGRRPATPAVEAAPEPKKRRAAGRGKTA